MDIGDKLRLTACCGGTTNAMTEGNPDAGGLADKRPQHQFPAHDAVKSGPI